MSSFTLKQQLVLDALDSAIMGIKSYGDDLDGASEHDLEIDREVQADCISELRDLGIADWREALTVYQAETDAENVDD